MKNILSITLLFIAFGSIAQSTTQLDTIKELGKEWKFEEAISVINEELKSDPLNPELYYWLGRYSHYLVYDTRPFGFKSNEWSKDQVLSNFQKAIELSPDYGDAKYFIAAEYGARALEAIKSGDINQYKQELIDAEKWGGFPLHAIEYGERILKSCDPHAILFVNGDAEFNIIQYVQAIKGFRKDVSVVCIALLERPYYIKYIRDGLPDVMRPVPTTMTDNLIMEMHNYKWKENIIKIPVPDSMQKSSQLSDILDCINWNVKPDAGRSKLKSSTAMIIDIILANAWERPVNFTLSGEVSQQGLEDYLQKCGHTTRLVPAKVKGTPNEYDIEKFKAVMFNPTNYQHYSDIKENNQPRASFSFGQESRLRILTYANFCLDYGNMVETRHAIKVLEELMPHEVHPYADYIEEGINMLKVELDY